MSRVGNTSNLSAGDTYDLLSFDFVDGFPVGNIKLGFGKNPKRISGVQKVAQVFTKCLLTTKGSDPIHNLRGSDFTKYAIGANRSESDAIKVRTEIADTVADAAAQAQGILNVPGASPESRLETAQVVKLNTTRDGTDISIRIVTEAGETAPIALPFTSLGLKVNA